MGSSSRSKSGNRGGTGEGIVGYPSRPWWVSPTKSSSSSSSSVSHYLQFIVVLLQES